MEVFGASAGLMRIARLSFAVLKAVWRYPLPVGVAHVARPPSVDLTTINYLVMDYDSINHTGNAQPAAYSTDVASLAARLCVAMFQDLPGSRVNLVHQSLNAV